MKNNVLLRTGVLLASALTAGGAPTHAQMTTIHSFTGTNGDGEYPFPYGRLLFDNNGALYGTTAGGGTNNNGTVYQLVPQSGGGWAENVLYEFQGSADGRQAAMGVVFEELLTAVGPYLPLPRVAACGPSPSFTPSRNSRATAPAQVRRLPSIVKVTSTA